MFKLKKEKNNINQYLENFIQTTCFPYTFWILDADKKIIANHPGAEIDKNTFELLKKTEQTREPSANQDIIILPINFDHRLIGFTVGKNAGQPEKKFQAAVECIHQTVTLICSKEIEKKSIAADAIQKYREINLLYQMGETMSSCFDLEKIPRLILNSSMKIIQADAGWILLKENQDELKIKASLGDIADSNFHIQTILPLIASIIKTDEAEIINNLKKDPRTAKRECRIKSLICIPLKNKEETIGAIILANLTSTQIFTAEELKLLNALAFQGTVTIANALLIKQLLDSEKMTTLGQLASTIVHDIKNPMFIIRTFAELLANPKLSEDKVSKYTGIIVTEIDRLTNLTAEILEFAKGESNINFREHNFGQIIEGISTFLERDFENSNINLIINNQYKGPVTLDIDKIKRVFFNIASNAKDAMPEGGEFQIQAERQNNHIVINLADSGKGMPEEVLKKLFEPFFTYGKKQGTGLGMPIVEKIIVSHQGTITCESEQNKGTKFQIKLPLKT